MIVVPEEEYNKLKLCQQQLLHIQQTTMKPLETSFQKAETVLMQNRDNLPPDQLLKTYGNIIQSNIHGSKKTLTNTKDESTITRESGDSTDDWLSHLLNELPKSHRKRALQLYKFLLNKNVKFSPNGEVITHDNKVFMGSNVVDLIHYLTADIQRKNRVSPPYLTEFIEYLKELHMPTLLLGRFGYSAYQRSGVAVKRFKPTVFGADDDDEEEEGETYHDARCEWERLM